MMFIGCSNGSKIKGIMLAQEVVKRLSKGINGFITGLNSVCHDIRYIINTL